MDHYKEIKERAYAISKYATSLEHRSAKLHTETVELCTQIRHGCKEISANGNVTGARLQEAINRLCHIQDDTVTKQAMAIYDSLAMYTDEIDDYIATCQKAYDLISAARHAITTDDERVNPDREALAFLASDIASTISGINNGVYDTEVHRHYDGAELHSPLTKASIDHAVISIRDARKVFMSSYQGGILDDG